MSQGTANQRAKRIGRRTKLTPQIQASIVENIRNGCTAITAARAAGIGPSTLHEWMARGKGEHCQRPENATYAAFAEAVETAKGEFEAECIQRIHTAAERDWRANAWLLERSPSTRKRWRRTDQVSYNGEVKLAHVHALTTVELIDRIKAARRLINDPASLPSADAGAEGPDE